MITFLSLRQKRRKRIYLHCFSNSDQAVSITKGRKEEKKKIILLELELRQERSFQFERKAKKGRGRIRPQLGSLLFFLVNPIEFYINRKSKFRQTF